MVAARPSLVLVPLLLLLQRIPSPRKDSRFEELRTGHIIGVMRSAVLGNARVGLVL